MKKLFLILFFCNCTLMSSYSKTYLNHSTDTLFQKILYRLDTCLDEEIKVSIQKNDPGEFIEYGSIKHSNELSGKIYLQYINCFDLVDTLIHSDSEFKLYFGNLIDEFRIYVFRIIRKGYYCHLKNETFDFNNEIDSLRAKIIIYDSLTIAMSEADSIEGYYIPKDLNDALNQLDTIFKLEVIERFKNYTDEETAINTEHFGIGLHLRNRWKLGGSRLHKYFSFYGISTHDYLSSIILTVWYRRLHQKPLNVDDLLKYYSKLEILNNEGINK